MPASLFISYGHADQAPVNWLDRLQQYLAQSRQLNAIDPWADTRIQPGARWRDEIAAAMERASAAILLVGPAFLGSEFIASDELPTLLKAAAARGCSVYPVVTGYCAYRTSVLEPYQAVNNPDVPLEALEFKDQNRVLNDLSITVDREIRGRAAAGAGAAAVAPPLDRGGPLAQTIREIARALGDTRTAFRAQAARRDELVAAIRQRLTAEHLQYEKFFQKYYPQLSDAERFVFDQIRAMTDGPLHDGNQRILTMIERQPAVLDEIPSLVALRQHLVFWLNKYDKVFARRPDMCLLYTGVEDRVPFPDTIDRDISGWLKAHDQ